MRQNTIKLARECVANRSGATAIEYGLIAALIAVGLIGALTMTSGSLSTMWADSEAPISTALSR